MPVTYVILYINSTSIQKKKIKDHLTIILSLCQGKDWIKEESVGAKWGGRGS